MRVDVLRLTNLRVASNTFVSLVVRTLARIVGSVGSNPTQKFMKVQYATYQVGFWTGYIWSGLNFLLSNFVTNPLIRLIVGISICTALMFGGYFISKEILKNQTN